MPELNNSLKANFSRRLRTAGVFFLWAILQTPTQAANELHILPDLDTRPELHTREGEALFVLGKAAFRSGDYVGAIAAFHEAQSAGFSKSVLLYNLGVAHYRLNQFNRLFDIL